MLLLRYWRVPRAGWGATSCSFSGAATPRLGPRFCPRLPSVSFARGCLRGLSRRFLCGFFYAASAAGCFNRSELTTAATAENAAATHNTTIGA